jgi:hypothetical protein
VAIEVSLSASGSFRQSANQRRQVIPRSISRSNQSIRK